MQLPSGESCSPQSVTHSCTVQHSKPSKWSVPSLLSVRVSSNQHYCKVDVSMEGFLSSCKGKIDSVHCHLWSSRTFFFLSLRSKWTQRATPSPPSLGLSSGSAQPSLPRLLLKKLPVGIDDSLWGLSVIPPLCPAVTSIRIWLTEEAWVICKEQQGFSFIILVGGQGANDWAWITRECGIQGRKKPNRLPKEGRRGCRWKVPG